MKILFYMLIVLCYISSCKNKGINKLITNTNILLESAKIDNRITDTVEIELGNISESLEVVKLETSNNILLGNIYSINVGRQYIVIGTERDYYLFTRNGKYVRKAFQIGRGPEEFMRPKFSEAVRNDELFIYDNTRSKQFIYCLNLATGSQKRIPKTDGEIIASFIPDTDSTLLIITQKAIAFKPPTIFSSEFVLIKQDLNGNLINKFYLGNYTENEWPFHYLKYSLLAANDSILIISPQCDSILLFHSNKNPTLIWRNIFDVQISSTESRIFNLLHFSENFIILSEQIREYNGKSEKLKKRHLLLINKRAGTQSVPRLFFINKRIKINGAILCMQQNGQFAVAIAAADFDFLSEDPLYKDYLGRLKISEPDSNNRPITVFSNPYIILGRFN